MAYKNAGTTSGAGVTQDPDEIEFCTPNSSYDNIESYIVGKRIG